jgi:hypothetical protein
MHFHEVAQLTPGPKDYNLVVEFRILLPYANAKGEPVRNLKPIGRKSE